jgi:hypothetical protein
MLYSQTETLLVRPEACQQAGCHSARLWTLAAGYVNSMQFTCLLCHDYRCVVCERFHWRAVRHTPKLSLKRPN